MLTLADDIAQQNPSEAPLANKGADEQLGTALPQLDDDVVPEQNDLPTKIYAEAAFRIPHFQNDQARKTLSIGGTLTLKTGFKPDPSSLQFYVGERIASSNIRMKKQRQKRETCTTVMCVTISVAVTDIETMPIHNALKLRFLDADGIERFCGVRWASAMPRKYLALHGPYYVDDQHGLTAFFRQNVGKKTTLTVRHTNVTDSNLAHVKIGAAWALSKLAFWLDPVLIFEKVGRHYEESGRAVFERLVDNGNKNVWFVIDADAASALDVEERYRKKFLYQHTFKHYLYFFSCTRFLGTEALAHCFELRSQSILVQRKLKSKKNRYVFMQHGVMYMVSLDSPERSSFRKRNMPGKAYIVASSELEARHFIDYAGFERDDIIVCGLPKFDNSYLNPDASKILVMPTWRPWEFAQMRIDAASTTYVKMVNRIVNAIPEELKGNVVVAPHPLFDASLFEAGGTNADAITSYDTLLRDVKLLITDYSSIAYDAFYRGANVIFYWEELEDCMAHYGEPTHLMIDQDTAFGPVCLSPEELRMAAKQLYGQNQQSKYTNRYKKIVEHHDGHNSERLLQALHGTMF